MRKFVHQIMEQVPPLLLATSAKAVTSQSIPSSYSALQRWPKMKWFAVKNAGASWCVISKNGAHI
jgi:hypothetical protein